MTRYISFAVLLAIIIVIGALFYRVMIGFFVPVFLAAVLVVVFRPLHRWVLSRVGERDHLASGITTSLIVLIVLLPAGVVLSLAAVQGVRFVSNVNWNNIEYGLNKLRGNDWMNLDYPHADEVRAIQNKINEIQNLATSQTSISSIISDKETFQSDLKEIQRLIKEDLTPQLEEMPAAEASKKILKANSAKSKTGNRPELAKDGSATSTQLRAELKEYFERITKQIRDKLAERDLIITAKAASESDVDQVPLTYAETIAELQAQPIESAGNFTDAEKAILDSVRRNYIEQSVAWHQVKAELDSSLNALEAKQIQDYDIVQIQK
nr:hypothetical protein [Pirellula sp.]